MYISFEDFSNLNENSHIMYDATTEWEQAFKNLGGSGEPTFSNFEQESQYYLDTNAKGDINWDKFDTVRNKLVEKLLKNNISKPIIVKLNKEIIESYLLHDYCMINNFETLFQLIGQHGFITINSKYLE
jgi:hypothetical protein